MSALNSKLSNVALSDFVRPSHSTRKGARGRARGRVRGSREGARGVQTTNVAWLATRSEGDVRQVPIVGLQPTVIASRAPHLLLEQSVAWVRREEPRSPASKA